jgi:hypothetical protein
MAAGKNKETEALMGERNSIIGGHTKPHSVIKVTKKRPARI